MPRKNYFICPDCGKRGVYLRLGVPEDWWQCRYCSDFACCANGIQEDWDGKLVGNRIDLEQYRRLQAANPNNDLIPN